MATMRVAQITAPKAKFEIVERPIPEAAPGTVRIKVAACGVCHSDSLVKEGLWPGLQYPTQIWSAAVAAVVSNMVVDRGRGSPNTAASKALIGNADPSSARSKESEHGAREQQA